MTSVISLAELVDVVIGVDTHVDSHTACALQANNGAVLDRITVPTTPAGYQQLIEFADNICHHLAAQHTPPDSAMAELDIEPAVLPATRAWAIEGTCSHGAGFTRLLSTTHEVVYELDRPQRARRRNGRKSDPLDAERAAREALARPQLGTPRATHGDRQVLAQLLSARSSAVQAATDAQRQLFSWVIAAPDEIRERLRGRRGHDLLRTASRLRGHTTWTEDTRAIAQVLATVARRALSLIAEATQYEHQIRGLVTSWRPDLIAQTGVGPIVAATVLCAWSHPGRIHSEAGFAMLAGTAPIPANSGQVTTHYRLNKYGDRRLNQALHVVMLTRKRCHAPTRAYVERRTTEGKTPREIGRCLKRYIARDLYRLLEHPATPLDRT